MIEAVYYLFAIVALAAGMYAGSQYTKYTTHIGCTKISFKETQTPEQKFDTVGKYISEELKGAKIYRVMLDTGDRFIDDDCLANYRKAKSAIIHFSARKGVSNA